MDNIERIIELFEELLDELDAVDFEETLDSLSDMEQDELKDLRISLEEWSEDLENISSRLPDIQVKLSETKLELEKLSDAIFKAEENFEDDED